MSDAEVVWVAAVDHRHGRDFWLSKTSAGATQALADYCRDNWDELTGRIGLIGDEAAPEVAPGDDDEAIRIYFEIVTDEFFDLNQAAVLP